MKVWVFLAILMTEGQAGVGHTPVAFFADERDCKLVQAFFHRTHIVGQPDPTSKKTILARQSYCWRFDGPDLGEPA